MFTFIAGEEVKVLSMDTYLAWFDARQEELKPFSSPLAYANENFLYETGAYKENSNGIWETVYDNKDRLPKNEAGRVAVYRWGPKPVPEFALNYDASTMTAEEIYKALDEMGE